MEKNKKAPGQWCELHILTPDGWTEAVAGYLFEAGVGAVEERVEPEGVALVSHLPYDDFLNDALVTLGNYLAEVSKMCGNPKLPKITFRKIKNRAWAAESRRGFKSIRLVEGVEVAPTWDKTAQKSPGTRLKIDPGEAFGTGLHPSTKLCAELMVKAIERYNSPSLLDVGTGTGILAMTALAKGAGEVTANDIDPKAVEVATANFKLNAAAVKITDAPVERMRKKFDIVVANILLEELERLAKHFARLTRPGGTIVFGGLLESQARMMGEKMEEAGVGNLWLEKADGEWIAMAFLKS